MSLIKTVILNSPTGKVKNRLDAPKKIANNACLTGIKVSSYRFFALPTSQISPLPFDYAHGKRSAYICGRQAQNDGGFWILES